MNNAQTRRERRRTELRAEILDAARALFIDHGFDGFSMRKLAEKIGYSHAGIYLYFKNKAQLFDCLVDESFAQLLQRLQTLQPAIADKDPVEILKQGARAYVEFGLANPHIYEFAFILRRKGPQRRWQPHRAFEAAQNLVRRCVDEKRFRPVNVETASQALWAAMHGVTSLLLLRPSFPWVSKNALIGRVIDSAVDSLLAGPAPVSGKKVPRAKRSRA